MISRDLIESSLSDHTNIVWQEFWNDLGSLRKLGWLVQELPKFDCWKRQKDSNASHRYLYIREPKTRMIGRGIIEGVAPTIIHLEYLCQESNKWVKPPKVLEERELTAADIPALLDLIAEIQNRQPVKRRKKAEIIELRAIG